MLLLGLIKAPAPGELAVHVSYFIVFGYLPMIYIGWHAALRRVWAIRMGLVHAAIFMAINLINVTGAYTFGAEKFISEKDPLMRSMSLTLFYLAIAFITANYILANVSFFASTRQGPVPPAQVPGRPS
jgi:hypothetical protein